MGLWCCTSCGCLGAAGIIFYCCRCRIVTWQKSWKEVIKKSVKRARGIKTNFASLFSIFIFLFLGQIQNRSWAGLSGFSRIFPAFLPPCGCLRLLLLLGFPDQLLLSHFPGKAELLDPLWLYRHPSRELRTPPRFSRSSHCSGMFCVLLAWKFFKGVSTFWVLVFAVFVCLFPALPRNGWRFFFFFFNTLRICICHSGNKDIGVVQKDILSAVRMWKICIIFILFI